jgi:hypothetical protein
MFLSITQDMIKREGGVGKITGSHGGEYVDDCLLRFFTV